MSEQPWSVYQLRSGRCVVKRWFTNAGLVGIFVSKEVAHEYARRENRAQKEDPNVRRGAAEAEGVRAS